ncbi:hypothetical protein ACMYM1_23590, partial [Salmonella enterica subsp. enterica serovar Enteritidis]
ETEPDQAAITAAIADMIKQVQRYVPGYKLVNGPVFDGNRVSIFMEVEGLGDYLPKYAGKHLGGARGGGGHDVEVAG